MTCYCSNSSSHIKTGSSLLFLLGCYIFVLCNKYFFLMVCMFVILMLGLYKYGDQKKKLTNRTRKRRRRVFPRGCLVGGSDVRGSWREAWGSTWEGTHYSFPWTNHHDDVKRLSSWWGPLSLSLSLSLVKKGLGRSSFFLNSSIIHIFTPLLGQEKARASQLIDCCWPQTPPISIVKFLVSGKRVQLLDVQIWLWILFRLINNKI